MRILLPTSFAWRTGSDFRCGRGPEATMSFYEDKEFRSAKESGKEPAQVFIRMGHPRIRAHVIPISGATEEPTTRDFATSYCAAWQPTPSGEHGEDTPTFEAWRREIFP